MVGEPIGHGVRRMCIAVDLEHYSRWPDAVQIEAQRAVAKLVRDAGESGALEPARWLIQAQGDGELAMLPPGVDKAHVITSLWRGLREGVRRYNQYVSPAARLRMRVAVHEGLVLTADNGFVGDAVITVCPLLDSAEAKDALRNADGDLVLIVSDDIYDDAIRGYGSHDLPASAFTEVIISMPDKGFRAQAFIFDGRSLPTPGAAPMPFSLLAG